MVSMNRQLPKEHPIHALFAPHVEGTALINWGAHEVGAVCIHYLHLGRLLALYRHEPKGFSTVS